jgi:hypothetical protein
MSGDLVLDPEFFPFKFNDTEIVGMRPVDFLVDCGFDGRVLATQRRYTLICCHSGPPMSFWYADMLDHQSTIGKPTAAVSGRIGLWKAGVTL